MHVRIRRVLATTAAGVLLAAASVGTAYADDVTNNLDASVDAAAEHLSLTVGGGNGSTLLSIVERNGDGKNGCNLTGSTTATFALTTSNSVSPSSVTFSSCGDVKTVTVTPHAEGTASVALTQTTNTTAGSFNVDPAAFTVNVAAPVVTNTPPVVGVT